MAIGIVTEFSNLNEHDYDRVIETMGLTNNPPKGLLLHVAAGLGPGGLRVTNIFESRELFDLYYKERVYPTLNQLRINTSPTRQEFFQVHNLYAPQPNALTKLTRFVAAGSSR